MLTVAQARPSERAKFIQQTYMHLAGAVGAFIILEFLFFQTGIAAALTNFVAASRFSWLFFLGAFALLGWLSRGLAEKADSVGTQSGILKLYTCTYLI